LLETALLLNLAIHVIALAGMGLLLMPGLPGGPRTDVAERAAYLAAHPWLWRLGWLTWQLTAGLDLLLAIALVRTSWVPRLPALFTLAATLVAVVPDQLGEFAWITTGVSVAGEAVRTGDAASYLAFEIPTMFWVGGVGGALYLLMALGWAWCVAAAGISGRGQTVLMLATCFALAFGSVPLLLPPERQPPAVVLVGGSVVGFPLLLVWLVLVNEAVLRRCRPEAPHGRYATWRYPCAGWWGRLCETVASSRLSRYVGEWLPTVSFASDITDVIYVNYLVEAGRLRAYLPPGLELQTLGPGGRFAMFSFLTYQHGHLGPALLGPFRRLLPSPVQSNWRIYVKDPGTGNTGIYFVTNAVSALPQALGARLMSEGMPMHLLAHGSVAAGADGSFTVLLDGGVGSAPDAEVRARLTIDRTLDGLWRECFADYQAMLAHCVPQDRALSTQPWYDRVTRQEIELGIPLSACEPLEATVRSKAAERVVGTARPVCFRVAGVAFRFLAERHDRLQCGAASSSAGAGTTFLPSPE
jgi:hypothetical protein